MHPNISEAKAMLGTHTCSGEVAKGMKEVSHRLDLKGELG